MPASYPAHREADVVLRDGSTAHVRPIRASDREALHAFYEALSPDSRAFRFFSGAVDLDEIAATAVDVDYNDRYGLVATSGGQTVVAHALYFKLDAEHAEVAFAIADRLQGRGLGTILLAHLAELAEDHGVRSFEASVLPQNHRMIEVFRESGFPIEVRAQPGEIAVELPTSFSAEAIERFEQRDRIAAVAAVSAFLQPASVAVIGASRRRGSVGGEVFHNLLSSGFEGPVYPVNASADVVQSVAAYRSILSVPGPVELAVIAVPADSVPDAARECAEKGVRALIVLSAGFGETGPEGARRQGALLDVCRDAGMRLVGPNCLGALNTSAGASLNATFAPGFPPAGPVGFLSQSGALGLAMIEHALEAQIGLSSFASIGNRADISGNDLIEYWEQDSETRVVLLYLESFGNPRRFARIARRVGRHKPIVAVKSGRSAAGARATTSHTGAMIAASDVTVDALFHQAGVVRTDNLAELFDVASVLSNQPVPGGHRVGVVTNAGGPGIMCADACEAAGLELPEPSDGVRERLAKFLPPEASLANPIDMIATASADDYERTIEAIAESGEVDAIIAVFVRPLLVTATDVAEAIGRASEGRAAGLTLLGAFMSAEHGPAELRRAARGVPAFQFPEEAAQALARVTAYSEWLRKPEQTVPRFPEARGEEAAGLLANALERGEGWLEPAEASALLDCYGIRVASWLEAEDPTAAGRAAAQFEGSVALKAVVPGLHKTEAGAVRLGLSGEDAVSTAAEEMRERLRRADDEPQAFIVQEMITEGVEMLVGLVHDPLFGPLLACGAGGVQAELLKDLSVRITPLREGDASEMVRSLQTFPLLEGFRGAPPADVGALEDVLLRMSALVEAHAEVAEVDLNPLIVGSNGATVVDVRIRAQAAQPRPPWPGYRH
ncbi:MAG TPA: GNAT family N-acetyltransferase [Solirubrobacterales bacterium]|nr:GNAT family N-acetyltransferase [Solirubrobacterales bacterium]